jgi:hypothetical protein
MSLRPSIHALYDPHITVDRSKNYYTNAYSDRFAGAVSAQDGCACPAALIGHAAGAGTRRTKGWCRLWLRSASRLGSTQVMVNPSPSVAIQRLTGTHRPPSLRRWNEVIGYVEALVRPRAVNRKERTTPVRDEDARPPLTRRSESPDRAPSLLKTHPWAIQPKGTLRRYRFTTPCPEYDIGTQASRAIV